MGDQVRFLPTGARRRRRFTSSSWKVLRGLAVAPLALGRVVEVLGDGRVRLLLDADELEAWITRQLEALPLAPLALRWDWQVSCKGEPVLLVAYAAALVEELELVSRPVGAFPLSGLRARGGVFELVGVPEGGFAPDPRKRYASLGIVFR